MIHLTPFAVSGIFTAITFLPLFFLVVTKGTTRLSLVFSLHLLSVTLWGVGAFFIGINTNETVALQVWKFATIPVLFISVFFLHSVLILTGKESKPLVIFSYTQAFFFVYAILAEKCFSSTRLVFNSFYYTRDTVYYFASFVIWMFLVVYAQLKLIQYYRQSFPKQKKELLLLILVVPIGFGGGTTNYLPGFGIDIYPYGNFGVPVCSFFYAYIVLKHHLFDIAVTIRKSLAYSLLIAFVSIVYLVFVVVLERLFQGVVGYRSIFFTASIAFVIGIIFIPLRNRIQYFIDRLFFKGTTAEIAQQNELLLKEVAKTERMRAVSILASGMAHEIKNPLTAIKTFSEFLPQKKNDPQFLEKYARIVGGEAQRINDLVHQLLGMAKPAPPQIQKINIHLLIDNLLDFLSSEFIRRRISVKKEYQAQDLLIDLDPNQFRQVFLNLFMNATDAMKDGGTLMISAYLRSSGASPSAIICVKDTGCGISSKDLPHIFEPFFTKKEFGTGLGLSVVQEIITTHKGKIRVESEVGKGTTFTVELPLTT